jgi:hypothetical protein
MTKSKTLHKAQSNMRLNNSQCMALVKFIQSGCKNLSQAVIDTGYSPASVQPQVAQLLKNEAFNTIVKIFTEKSISKSGQDVLRELELIGFFDIKDLFEYGTGSNTGENSIKMKNVLEMGKESRNIKKIKHEQRTVYGADGEVVAVVDKYEYELWDKMKALEMLGNNLRLFDQDQARDKDNTELLPRIYLPDNGKGGQTNIAIAINKK